MGNISEDSARFKPQAGELVQGIIAKDRETKGSSRNETTHVV
jgi:hypothetical protein